MTAPLEHIYGFPNNYVEEHNTFDLKVVFTKKIRLISLLLYFICGL